MQRIIILFFALSFCLGSFQCRATERALAVTGNDIEVDERALAVTDKDLYVTGERLHISVCITDRDHRPSSLSRVAYVEISDTHHLCAHAMVALDCGRGWAEIALPSTLHSGNYLLSVYTRAMRNLDLTRDDALFSKVISIVNPSHVSRADNIIYLPKDSITESPLFADVPTLYPDAQGRIAVPSALGRDLILSAISVMRHDLTAPDYSDLRPDLRMLTSRPRDMQMLPEIEGHLVLARPTDPTSVISQTCLVMVGRQTAIYDGQWQPDGSWLYYTTGLYGKRPALLSTCDVDGSPVSMEFISPFAKVIPSSMPRLEIGCTADQLQLRAESAQREHDISTWLAVDSLGYNADLLSSEPKFSYDLDEYTKFKSVREILVEFVRGVKREKVNGADQLFVLEPDQSEYSQWSALVLLDGMPIYNIRDILDYDARLLKYVKIYTDRYTFGNTIYGGIISFTSLKGLLSNFNLDSMPHLVSYNFPQDHPRFIMPDRPQAGTVFWSPDVSRSFGDSISIQAPSAPGSYRILLQAFDAAGNYICRAYRLEISPNQQFPASTKENFWSTKSQN